MSGMAISDMGRTFQPQVQKRTSRSCDGHSLVCNDSLRPEFGPVKHKNGSYRAGMVTCVRVGPLHLNPERGPFGLKLALLGLT